MDDSQVNNPSGQLPSVSGQDNSMQPTSVNTNVPANGVPLTPAQQAQQLLSASSSSPYQMAQQFIELKNRYLQEHGVQIGE